MGLITTNVFTRHKKITVVIALVIVCAIFIIVAANFMPNNGTTAKAGGPTDISTSTTTKYETVGYGSITNTITGSGAIESSSTKNVASEVSAYVDEVLVEVGDKVSKGDVIFKLDSSDLETQIRNKNKSISNYQDSVDKWNDTIADYKEDIANLNVYSTLTGYVSNLKVSEGDNVNKNSVVFEVTNDDYYTFTANFNYVENAPVNIGDRVEMRTEISYVSLVGYVAKISDIKSSNEVGGQLQEIEVRIDNPGYTLDGVDVCQEYLYTQSGVCLRTDDEVTIKSSDSKSFKVKSTGEISKLNISNGQYINVGDLVMVLDGEDLQESLENAEKSLKDAKENLSDAYTELADLKDDYSFYTITAPIDGIVTSVSVNVDDYIRSEGTLCKIVNNDVVEFDISVDELDINNIKVGQEVKVTIDALEETEKTPITGYVSEIALEGTNMNSVTSYPVTITLSGDDRIKMGMNCTAEIVTESATDVLVVPVEAISTRRNKYYVTNESGDRVEITIGIYDEDNAEVKSGLKEGDKVAIATQIVKPTTDSSSQDTGFSMFSTSSSTSSQSNNRGGFGGGNMGGGSFGGGGSMGGGMPGGF